MRSSSACFYPPCVLRGPYGARADGFTLLELILAVTLLASFVLPLLLLLAESKVRAHRYTIERQVRELSHKKLFDRIHYYETQDAGTFELEGHPSWRWEVLPPQLRGQSEQILLEYTIRVTIPQKLESAGAASEEGGTTYEYTVWTFPDERWYEEQQYLYESGQPSLLYGDPVLQAAGGNY